MVSLLVEGTGRELVAGVAIVKDADEIGRRQQD
jgi:hypothetical protein